MRATLLASAGERTVPLTRILVNTLREWKLACPKGKQDLAFPTGSGNIEGHSNIVNRGLAPTLIAAGVTVDGKGEDGKPVKLAKYPGLHAFRHFYASWCINRRAEGGLELLAKVVQERLGHSSITMTLDVYGHLFPRGDDSAELAAAERSLLA
jgi:integrase